MARAAQQQGGGVTIDPRDLDLIARVVASETPNSWLRSESGQNGVKGVIDVILNRTSDNSGRFPNTIEGVLNQTNQFSAVSGNKDAKGSADRLGRASPAMAEFVASYIRDRANGAPATVGGALNFANPTSPLVSSRSRGWVDEVAKTGQVYGRGGNDIHVYGTPSSQRPHEATNIRLTGDISKPAPGSGRAATHVADRLPDNWPRGGPTASGFNAGIFDRVADRVLRFGNDKLPGAPPQRNVVQELFDRVGRGRAGVRSDAVPPSTQQRQATLRQGMEGPQVKALQQDLIRAGLLDAKGADGKFGPQTAAAVRSLEQKFSLPTQDRGIAGREVFGKLGQLGGGQLPPPVPQATPTQRTVPAAVPAPTPSPAAVTQQNLPPVGTGNAYPNMNTGQAFPASASRQAGQTGTYPNLSAANPPPIPPPSPSPSPSPSPTNWSLPAYGGAAPGPGPYRPGAIEDALVGLVGAGKIGADAMAPLAGRVGGILGATAGAPNPPTPPPTAEQLAAHQANVDRLRQSTATPYPGLTGGMGPGAMGAALGQTSPPPPAAAQAAPPPAFGAQPATPPPAPNAALQDRQAAAQAQAAKAMEDAQRVANQTRDAGPLAAQTAARGIDDLLGGTVNPGARGTMPGAGTLTPADRGLSYAPAAAPPPQGPIMGRGDIDTRRAGFNVMPGQGFSDVPFLPPSRDTGRFNAPAAQLAALGTQSATPPPPGGASGYGRDLAAVRDAIQIPTFGAQQNTPQFPAAGWGNAPPPPPPPDVLGYFQDERGRRRDDFLTDLSSKIPGIAPPSPPPTGSAPAPPVGRDTESLARSLLEAGITANTLPQASLPPGSLAQSPAEAQADAERQRDELYQQMDREDALKEGGGQSSYYRDLGGDAFTGGASNNLLAGGIPTIQAPSLDNIVQPQVGDQGGQGLLGGMSGMFDQTQDVGPAGGQSDNSVLDAVSAIADSIGSNQSDQQPGGDQSATASATSGDNPFTPAQTAEQQGILAMLEEMFGSGSTR